MSAALARRNLAAEVRAVTEGHRARLDPERHVLTVVSDTRPNTVYELVPQGIGGYLVVSCTCPAGAHWNGALGGLPCKHSARVARRLARHGLACVGHDGLWRLTDKARRHGVEVCEDPFEGLS